MAAIGETFENMGWFQPESHPFDDSGLRAVAHPPLPCGEDDLPLANPLKGAIVLSRTSGIWRMSADRNAADSWR
jgi:hypothetical protein